MVVSWLAARGVSVNPLSDATLVLASLAGIRAITAKTRWQLVLADVLLVIGILPALFGGVGLLYLPSLGLITAGISRPRRNHH